MDNWYTQYRIGTMHHQELIKEADNYRLLKNAFADSPKQIRAHQRLLLALGTKLVQWGGSIQARYSSLPQPLQAKYSQGAPR